MAKINNAVRVIEFENEREFYYKIQEDLISYIDDPDSRCYKVKNIQMVDKTHALVYFEEDLNVIMVKFFFNGEEVIVQEAPVLVPYYSIQEISLINDLGYITINDTEYEIEEVKYMVSEYGVRYAEIYLN
ncbi:MAG: hypothetical protein HFI79_09875 [Lachnospiraceae bacterium]|jgi:hypothetical protein|nr:hypothetical protein [Lachnospiraceae bacterium]